MRKNSQVFIVLLVFSVVFAGCKKDSDDARKNSIKYDGKEYVLSLGLLENYGKDSDYEGFNIDLTLMSSGFMIHEANGEIDSVSGIGNAIYFEIFTSDSTQLDQRVYNFDQEGTGAVGTFDYGQVGINFNVQTFEGDIYTIIQGTVTVNKTGNVYEITINCKDANGKDVTGYFKGNLKYYSYDFLTLKKAKSGKLRE